MYNEDVKTIKYAFNHQNGPDVLEAVVRFVLATIQQQFSSVGEILQGWEQEGDLHPTMWGMKRNGVAHIAERKHEYAALIKGSKDVIEVIDLLICIPGLNTVKAAFVAQLLGYEVGCIDTHNAKMYGIRVASFKVPSKLSAKTRLAKIQAYVALCEGLGGSEQLWNTWCELVASKQSAHFKDAEDVSSCHAEWILRQLDPA